MFQILVIFERIMEMNFFTLTILFLIIKSIFALACDMQIKLFWIPSFIWHTFLYKWLLHWVMTFGNFDDQGKAFTFSPNKKRATIIFTKHIGKWKNMYN